MLDTLNWSYDSEFSPMLLPMFIIYIYSVLLLTQRNIANLVHKWHQDDQIICSSHSPPLVSCYATAQLEMRTRALKRTKKNQGCFLPDACCSWCRRSVACVESRPSNNYAHQAQHAGHTPRTWRRRRMQPASMLCRPSGAHERASHVTLAGHSYRTHAAHQHSRCPRQTHRLLLDNGRLGRLVLVFPSSSSPIGNC